MTVAEIKLKRTKPGEGRESISAPEPPLPLALKRRFQIIPFLITLATVAVAVALGWAMWGAYMDAPWTRDGTVRAYVVMIAPEVEGRIVELPVADNQFVHKGDLLVLIDPTNFRIAVRQAEAALRQAQATAQNIDAQVAVQQAQINASQAQVNQSKAALVFAQQQAMRFQELAQRGAGTVQNAQQFTSQLLQQQAALETAQANLQVAQRQVDALKAQRSSAEATIAQATAQLDQARVNLERTQIRSAVNGWVTNLLMQLGDFASTGKTVISLVNADSFWVDAYFEETQLAGVREGDPVETKMMGYSQTVRGRVGSIARGINVANATPNSQGLATVNPIFTWVRLAQRVPVRIQINQVPEGVTLVAGMTATVQINGRARAQTEPAAEPLALALRNFMLGHH
jgi:multidrug resistance efflux pump